MIAEIFGIESIQSVRNSILRKFKTLDHVVIILLNLQPK